MATLSPSNMNTVGAYGTSTWATTYNNNFTLLNSTLLKMQGLLDVNKTGLAAGKIMVYSTASSKWVPYTPPTHRKNSRL